jgi:hypothetical protein
MINVCETHNLQRRLVEVERGKTLYICPKCEEEKQARLQQVFGSCPRIDRFTR